jgi:hypothetical protein
MTTRIESPEFYYRVGRYRIDSAPLVAANLSSDEQRLRSLLSRNNRSEGETSSPATMADGCSGLLVHRQYLAVPQRAFANGWNLPIILARVCIASGLRSGPGQRFRVT